MSLTRLLPAGGELQSTVEETFSNILIFESIGGNVGGAVDLKFLKNPLKASMRVVRP